MAEHCKECGKKLGIFNKTYKSEDLCYNCFDEGNPKPCCKECDTTLECSLFGEEYCPSCREAEKQKAEQDRNRAEWERPHVVTFKSQSEYDFWLRKYGTQIEIIDTTASKWHGLLYSGTLHKTIFTVTFKYKKSESMQTAQPQVAAPMTPQQPTAIDIPEQIEKLGKLKEQGLLTENEFQSKKQELLSRL